MSRHALRTLTLFLVTATLALALTACGGGGGGSSGPEQARMTGTLDRDGLPREAARTANSLPSGFGDVTLVAVNTQNGSVGAVTVLGTTEDFSVVVPVGGPYLLQLLRGSAVLAVSDFTVTAPSGTGEKTGIELDVDLAKGEIDLKSLASSHAPLVFGTDFSAFVAAARALTDTDGDGMPDGWELAFGLDPNTAAGPDQDSDGDGLLDVDEFAIGTAPNNADTDGDGMPDAFEVANNLDPTSAGDANNDIDSDGLTNLEEFAAGTDPRASDSDGDGLPDGFEVANGLNPLANDAAADADGDGLTNAQEFALGTNPQAADTDGDGLPDAFEVANGLDPLLDDAAADADNDGLTNLQEFAAGTNPQAADTDGDGLPDAFEVANNLNPVVNDADADADGDGLTNLQEFALGTNPQNPDSDGDTVADNLDVFPLDPAESVDTDGDGIGNNADLDDDADGVADAEDSFPLDGTRFAAFTPATLNALAGGTFSAAVAVNSSGDVVGFSDDAGLTVNASLWTTGSGAATQLDALVLGAASAAYGNNDFGQVAGESDDGAGNFVAVVWNTAVAAPTQLPSLGGAWSAAYDINNAGLVVGEAEDATLNDRAAAWLVDGSGAVVFGPLDLGSLAGSTQSSAYFVADSGLVVGEARFASGEVRAVAWKVTVSGASLTSDGARPLTGIPAGTFSAAYGVNDDGLVAGESQDATGVVRPVTWRVDPATASMLSASREILAPAAPGSAYAVGPTGRVAGAVNGAVEAGLDGSVVWDDRFTDRTFAEPVRAAGLSRGYGVSLNGTVVGVFENASGEQQAFVADQN